MPRILPLLLLVLVLPLAAQPLLQPLPEPDLGSLTPGQAAAVRQQRAEFEQARKTLVGPPLAAAYGLIGGVYAQHGMLSTAQVAFLNALSLLPNDFELNYLAALVAMLGDDLEVAQRHFERALELGPDYPATRVHLAAVVARRGDNARAGELLRASIEAGHNVATAHARLGQQALEQRRHAQARQHFAAALEADPSASSLFRQLATAERALGSDEAARTLEAQAGDGRLSLVDPLGRGLFGPPAGPLDGILALVADGRLEAARVGLREHLARDTGDVAAMALMARVEAGLGQFESARRWAAYALRDGGRTALAQVAAGLVEETAGDEAAALRHYRRAVDLEADSSEARLMLGDLLMRQGRHEEAAGEYAAIAAGDAERAVGLPRMAAAKVMAGRCDEGLAAATAARAAHPRDGVRAELWVRLAATCEQASADQRDEAAELALALYEQYPDAETCEAAAMALAAVGRFDEALDLQRQALFELAKRGDREAIERSRSLLQAFSEQRTASLPWPQGHPLLAPPGVRRDGQ